MYGSHCLDNNKEFLDVAPDWTAGDLRLTSENLALAVAASSTAAATTNERTAAAFHTAALQPALMHNELALHSETMDAQTPRAAAAFCPTVGPIAPAPPALAVATAVNTQQHQLKQESFEKDSYEITDSALPPAAGVKNEANRRCRERWTPEEHAQMLEGLRIFGRKWENIQRFMRVKTVTQIRTRAYAYFSKMQSAGRIDELDIGPINGHVAKTRKRKRRTVVATPDDETLNIASIMSGMAESGRRCTQDNGEHEIFSSSDTSDTSSCSSGGDGEVSDFQSRKKTK
jgi:hypothetical protein